MQTVKNITSIKYFLDRFDTIDQGFSYNVNYHSTAPKTYFNSLPTFIADFYDCFVNSMPFLITEDQHLITEHVWPLLHKYKHKPQKIHGLWDIWAEDINIRVPHITRQFDETYTYVWLPIDEESANNPWHIWIDVISKFRLLEKKNGIPFSKYVYILSNPSKYFDIVAKELFPELRYFIMTKHCVWSFRHLLVPSMSNHNDGITTAGLAPWLRRFKNIVIPKNTKPTRKIFVSRNEAKTRKIVNAEQVIMALKGWEIVTLEHLSIPQQIKIFAEATDVLATHGAGLTNLLWCNKGTRVIEIQNRSMIHKKVYPVLSHHLNLKHEVYLADTVPIETNNNKKPAGVKRLNDLINFKIDVQKLIRHLN